MIYFVDWSRSLGQPINYQTAEDLDGLWLKLATLLCPLFVVEYCTIQGPTLGYLHLKSHQLEFVPFVPLLIQPATSFTIAYGDISANSLVSTPVPLEEDEIEYVLEAGLLSTSSAIDNETTRRFRLNNTVVATVHVRLMYSQEQSETMCKMLENIIRNNVWNSKDLDG